MNAKVRAFMHEHAASSVRKFSERANLSDNLPDGTIPNVGGGSALSHCRTVGSKVRGGELPFVVRVSDRRKCNPIDSSLLDHPTTGIIASEACEIADASDSASRTYTRRYSIGSIYDSQYRTMRRPTSSINVYL